MYSLRVIEIVSSLQGEGKFTGYPTTFVRLAGCNLKCSFCDTPTKGGKKMSVDTVASYIHRMGNMHVCITGGEPLLQDNCYTLAYDLTNKGYHVTIETNGSIPIPEYNYKRSFFYTMDIKCPSSGEEKRNNFENLSNLQAGDEVKFVVSNLKDYEYAKAVLKRHPTVASLIFSPVFSNSKEVDASWLVEALMDDQIPYARLGIQIHKLLNFY